VREGVEPTHDWQLLVPLFEWPEQERYEEIRPLKLFDVSVAERAAEVGTSASTRTGGWTAPGRTAWRASSTPRA
jgi:hypothetical protein